MKEAQRFALKNIYCSPAQDHQYRFSLVRITKPGFPVKKFGTVYNDQRPLPNSTSRFHLYVIGNIPLEVLNLLRKDRNWFKNVWYNAMEDMNDRNFIMQVYDGKGINFPREKIFYSSGWDGGLVIALEVDQVVGRLFDTESLQYLRLYSNQYFDTLEFNNAVPKPGIVCKSFYVANNAQKVAVQTEINLLEANGGKTLIYVDGYFSDKVTLHIPDNSYIEIVYDNSIESIETFKINEMRTFDSIKDNKLKYLLFRERTTEYIQYEDDLEVYVTGKNGHLTRGLYYYQHKDYSMTNVTDKDYALYTQHVNNQAQMLSDLIGGGISDKEITILTRKSGINRKLIYSSLKLHELYKLPDSTEFDVISNVNNTLTEFRVEHLENSDYFKVASASSVSAITKELATSTIGYNGISYYLGNTPTKVTDRNIDVPFLYRRNAIAYEYGSSGKLLEYHPSTGPMYTASIEAQYVEFLQGKITSEPSKLYNVNESIPLEEGEFRVLIAQYSLYNRISTWEDITDSNVCTYSDNSVIVDELESKRVRILYLDQAFIKDVTLEFVDGVMLFPVTVWEDRGNGAQFHLLDVTYDSTEVFLNGNRLTYGVDFFIDFPYIGICNKSYVRYSDPEQNIHIRMSGYNLDKTKINDNEIRGFVNNGVLTRNNYYDIREDKVFSVFMDGKLINNNTLRFSEEDNTVRLGSPINGLPYTMAERFVSITEATGLPTLPYYEANKAVNNKIAALYNTVYPEPSIDTFNVIPKKHYLYSPVVSKVIHDLLDGNISKSIYTSPYNDTTILELLNTTYKREMLLDPIKHNLPNSIVEIHPHYGNDTIPVNLYQYRFLSNLVRIITQGNVNLINLSGYLTVTNETVEIDPNPVGPGGIVVV